MDCVEGARIIPVGEGRICGRVCDGGESERVGQESRWWVREGVGRESGGVGIVGGFDGCFGDEEHDTVGSIWGGS